MPDTHLFAPPVDTEADRGIRSESGICRWRKYAGAVYSVGAPTAAAKGVGIAPTPMAPTPTRGSGSRRRMLYTSSGRTRTAGPPDLARPRPGGEGRPVGRSTFTTWAWPGDKTLARWYDNQPRTRSERPFACPERARLRRDGAHPTRSVPARRSVGTTPTRRRKTSAVPTSVTFEAVLKRQRDLPGTGPR